MVSPKNALKHLREIQFLLQLRNFTMKMLEKCKHLFFDKGTNPIASWGLFHYIPGCKVFGSVFVNILHNLRKQTIISPDHPELWLLSSAYLTWFL